LRTLFQLILIAVLASLAWLAYVLMVPPSHGHQDASVLIQPGWSARQIAFELERSRVVRSRAAFLVLHYARGQQSLKAGEYVFGRPERALDVYDRLVRGDILTRTVVIPEGYNLFEIAAALESAGVVPAGDFVRVARSDVALVADFDPEASSLEGYLYPDTYRFTRTQGAREVAATMVRRFRQEAKALGLNTGVRRTVILASIIEKETSVPEERPLVSSVFHNRLARNTVLAADPTVVYAAQLAGRFRGVIYKSDLEFDSPYNTYRHAGLPPGPIANPGSGSLAAAMRPAESDYLFFVSDNQGRHRFAASAAEHARNVAAYRQSVSQGRRR